MFWQKKTLICFAEECVPRMTHCIKSLFGMEMGMKGILWIPK